MSKIQELSAPSKDWLLGLVSDSLLGHRFECGDRRVFEELDDAGLIVPRRLGVSLTHDAVEKLVAVLEAALTPQVPPEPLLVKLRERARTDWKAANFLMEIVGLGGPGEEDDVCDESTE